ncbi:hypothetical protein BSL78_15886 [Apostichopus japonicus]|uniref:Uncharacterized protein n=1 Tax=Stichopus japonicus TaxID=307972 RepID=A0A2G8KGW2_STIJA|nr:hypothetical protein BSL78_15886 [Apostichopus japonicus]
MLILLDFCLPPFCRCGGGGCNRGNLQGVVIFENNPTQEIEGSVGIQTDPNTADVIGNNYWRVFVFFNDRPDGYGPAGRLLETEMTIPTQSRTQDLPAGGEIQFNPAQATVNFNTSCSIGEYMCFEIFNGLDILSPQVTLLGNVIHCFDVPCQGLQVSQTSLAIQNGLTFLEGETSHNIFFDVEVSSSSLGADGPADPTWQVRAFLSSADNSNGIINDTIVTGTIIENVLTPQLQAQQFFAGNSVQFSNVQASFSVEGLLCETTRFLCVEFGVVEGSAHSVAPVDGEANRLIDCQALSCTGVVVSSTSLELRNGEPLVSNQRNQELILTFEFRTALNSISVSGQGLYSIEIFPNNATDGQGTTPLGTRTTFHQRQVTSIVANTFSSVESFRITIALEGIRCDQMPFICGTLMRGPSPSPPYTLSLTQEIRF